MRVLHFGVLAALANTDFFAIKQTLPGHEDGLTICKPLVRTVFPSPISHSCSLFLLRPTISAQ